MDRRRGGKIIPDTFDVAVIGLGAIGGATAAALADRGHRVIAFDAYDPPHAMGSSHGGSRVIRSAYYHGSLYAPLVEAAYESWSDLEGRLGRSLMTVTGALMIGRSGASVFGRCLENASDPGFPYEILSPAEVASRFPAFHVPAGSTAVYEESAAVLDLDACLQASLEIARTGGATIRANEPVSGWTADGSGVRIVTDRAEYRARRLALAAGAWTGSLTGRLDLPLEVERTVQFWFEPISGDAARRLERPDCPVWVWEHEDRCQWYGFPLADGAVKAGVHIQSGRSTDPERPGRRVGEDEKSAMRAVIERFMPDAAGLCADAGVCMYTNTPDRHFVLDRHPDFPDVAMFAGGSGHGFKFARVLGEALADLSTDRSPGIDLEPFEISRFGGI